MSLSWKSEKNYEQPEEHARPDCQCLRHQPETYGENQLVSCFKSENYCKIDRTINYCHFELKIFSKILHETMTQYVNCYY